MKNCVSKINNMEIPYKKLNNNNNNNNNNNVNVGGGGGGGGIVVNIENDKKIKTSPVDGEKGWKNYIGIICCLLASMAMSLTALIVKMLPHYHPFTLTVWRYVGNIIPSIPLLIYYIWWKKENIFESIWPLFKNENCSNNEKKINCIGLLVRSVLGGAVTIFRFCALGYLTLADVSVIMRSTPGLVIFLAYFCLDEKCSIVSIVSALLAISGVFVLSRPHLLMGENELKGATLIGLGLSVGGLICSSINIIVSRKLRKLNFALLIFGFGIIGLLEGIILSWSIGEFKFPEGMKDILLIILLLTLTFIGQLFAVLAVKFDDAGTISIVRTSYVLFAFIWQIVFLQIYPDIFSIIGATTVLTGTLLISLRKWVITIPEQTKLRMKLNWLTK